MHLETCCFFKPSPAQGRNTTRRYEWLWLFCASEGHVSSGKTVATLPALSQT